MSGLDKIMSIEQIEARWRANPLDTTYPEIPWWHASPWCGCYPSEGIAHDLGCVMTPAFTNTACAMDFDPLELWPPDFWMFQLWMYCRDCDRKYGEINGSLRGHWCHHNKRWPPMWIERHLTP